MAGGPLAQALSRVVRIVSATLELKEVFAGVAEAAAAVLPFEGIRVVRFESPDTLTLYSVVGGVARMDAGVCRLTDFSPALRRHKAGAPGVKRVGDLAPLLDPRFEGDRSIQEEGWRSYLSAPLMRGDEVAGFVSVVSLRPDAFTAEHEAIIVPIAGLLSLAVEHDRLWSLDAARRRRLEALDGLLPAMARALTVSETFDQVSAVVAPVLSHDRLLLLSHSGGRWAVMADACSAEAAAAGQAEGGWPCEGQLCEGAEPSAEDLILDFEAHEDRRWRERCGSGSLLRIALHPEGGRAGALVFISKTPGQYTQEDLVVARRVADHVSLGLSHQRLAEEERQAAEARERASRLEARVDALKDELEASRGMRRVLGESKPWRDVLAMAVKVAATETTVLLTGDSGTGKEVVARFIHRGSPRARGPFVALNCAALPETLLESELFGHEKGAFTGAMAAHPGRIEQAAGGVLFLDEVGEMSPAVQAKLLRVLQEREYQRLGATRTLKANVRVVAATNRDLEAALAHGTFREDLSYRLRVFEIRMPPLRERREDILPMAAAFLEELGPSVGRSAAGISRDARDALLSYAWPGNVRELRNVLERATILCDGGLITLDHLPLGVARPAPAPAAAGAAGGSALPSPGNINLDLVERDVIVKALNQAHNNRSQAARLLGITRSQLYSRLQKHGLTADSAPAQG
jgi:transcriptional regulator with GAF, ATPase, and Fis domain